MKYKTEYFFCSPILLQNVDEINEIYSSIESIEWKENYTITVEEKNYEHQRAYNKSFQLILSRLGWNLNPRLCDNPRLIGDFEKNDLCLHLIVLPSLLYSIINDLGARFKCGLKVIFLFFKTPSL
ncbi:unnamed protein product [marine sediment metagenome]|uniref:Uncharacterized protein n=1 Tax=marine sediment metagenome TaxID=412755 RepID=X1RUX8_9ZZZZ